MLESTRRLLVLNVGILTTQQWAHNNINGVKLARGLLILVKLTPVCKQAWREKPSHAHAPAMLHARWHQIYTSVHWNIRLSNTYCKSFPKIINNVKKGVYTCIIITSVLLCFLFSLSTSRLNWRQK